MGDGEFLETTGINDVHILTYTHWPLYKGTILVQVWSPVACRTDGSDE